jgi:NADH-quinone oxidoreductase subunit L
LKNAFLHVMTHAFFKACLFLGAGSVMHGNGDEEDVTKLGGLRKEMPVTWLTFFISTMAITGIIPLSGFFSKDAILHAAHTQHIAGFHSLQTVAWILGTLTAACTAFYMMRAYFLAFEGERSKEAKIPHAHESAKLMTVPLVILAFLAVAASVHGIPFAFPHGDHTVHQTLMENFLDPVFRTTNELIAQRKYLEVPAEHGSMWGAWIQAWVIAIVSGGLAYFIYRRFLPSGGSLAVIEPLRKFSFNKFFVDEVYDFLIIKPLTFLSRILHRVVDALFIDSVLVHGTAWVTSRTGAVLRYVQTGDAQVYAAVMTLAAAFGLLWAVFRVLS